MGTAIKHHVPDRVKTSFVIFDIRALWCSPTAKQFSTGTHILKIIHLLNLQCNVPLTRGSSAIAGPLVICNNTTTDCILLLLYEVMEKYVENIISYIIILRRLPRSHASPPPTTDINHTICNPTVTKSSLFHGQIMNVYEALNHILVFTCFTFQTS